MLTIVAAHRSELPWSLARREEVTLQVVGPRPGWRDSVPTLAGRGPVLVTGTCGGLSAEALPGRLVLPDAIRAENGEILRPQAALRAQLVAGAGAAGLDLLSGVLAEVREVVAGESAWKGAGTSTGAACVDLESAALARECRAAGRPWAVLRYVSDAPGADLDWLRDLLGGWPLQDPRWDEVARGLLRRPHHLGRLFRLARRVRRGRGQVSAVVSQLLAASAVSRKGA